MKRNVKLIVCLIVALSIFVGCSDVNKNDIYKQTWAIEDITDGQIQIALDEAMPDYKTGDFGKVNNETDELTLAFSRDGQYVLTNENTGISWNGEYELEKVGSSYKINFNYQQNEIIGTYGAVKYNDGTEKEVVLIQTEGNLLTFVAK